MLLMLILHVSSVLGQSSYSASDIGSFEGKIIHVDVGKSVADGILYTPELRQTMAEYGLSDDNVQNILENQKLTGRTTTLKRVDNGVEKMVTLDFNGLAAKGKVAESHTEMVADSVFSSEGRHDTGIVKKKKAKIIPSSVVDKTTMVKVGNTDVVSETRVGPTEVISRKIIIGPEIPGPVVDNGSKAALEHKKILEKHQKELRDYQEHVYRRELERYHTNIRNAAEKRNKLGKATSLHISRISQQMILDQQKLPNYDPDSDVTLIDQLMKIPENVGKGKIEFGPGSLMQRLPGIVLGMGPTMPKFPKRFQVNSLKMGYSPKVNPLTNPYDYTLLRSFNNGHSDIGFRQNLASGTLPPHHFKDLPFKRIGILR